MCLFVVVNITVLWQCGLSGDFYSSGVERYCTHDLICNITSNFELGIGHKCSCSYILTLLSGQNLQIFFEEERQHILHAISSTKKIVRSLTFVTSTVKTEITSPMV